ncbi:hypothetical protein [Kutzneria sp. 744]|uniref:hypothetical protein n=1 Tax=Kutzneria sp. (strain 744) TaxID=345341 RepID=UPI0018DC1CCF|nr:hypothetical protein [Kutzneria sp. 744]
MSDTSPPTPRDLGSPLTFAVEHAGGGCVLVVSLPVSHPSNWLGLPTMAVTPSLVADHVRQALARGWKPQESGPAFEVKVSA